MAELVSSALSDSQFIDIQPFGQQYRDSILQFQKFLTRNIHQMTGNFRQPFYGLRYYYDDGNLTGLRSVESEITVNGNCLFDSLLYILGEGKKDETMEQYYERIADFRRELILHSLTSGHRIAYENLNQQASEERGEAVYREHVVNNTFMDTTKYVPAGVIKSFSDLKKRHVILFEIHTNGVLNVHIYINRNIPLDHVEFLMLHASHFTTFRKAPHVEQTFLQELKEVDTDTRGVTLGTLYTPDDIPDIYDRIYDATIAYNYDDLNAIFSLFDNRSPGPFINENYYPPNEDFPNEDFPNEGSPNENSSNGSSPGNLSPGMLENFRKAGIDPGIKHKSKSKPKVKTSKNFKASVNSGSPYYSRKEYNALPLSKKSEYIQNQLHKDRPMFRENEPPNDPNAFARHSGFGQIPSGHSTGTSLNYKEMKKTKNNLNRAAESRKLHEVNAKTPNANASTRKSPNGKGANANVPKRKGPDKSKPKPIPRARRFMKNDTVAAELQAKFNQEESNERLARRLQNE
jgi:hypothetical protein